MEPGRQITMPATCTICCQIVTIRPRSPRIIRSWGVVAWFIATDTLNLLNAGKLSIRTTTTRCMPDRQRMERIKREESGLRPDLRRLRNWARKLSNCACAGGKLAIYRVFGLGKVGEIS